MADPDDSATSPFPPPPPADNPSSVAALAATSLPIAITASGVIGPCNPAEYGYMVSSRPCFMSDPL